MRFSIRFLLFLAVVNCVRAGGLSILVDNVDETFVEPPKIDASPAPVEESTEEILKRLLANSTDVEADGMEENGSMPQGPELENKVSEVLTDAATDASSESATGTETDGEMPLPDPENPNPSGLMRCQNPSTKLFIPTAQACTDTRGSEICRGLFADPDLKTGKRDPRCDEPGMGDIANSCRKQCAICCEDMAYACEDDVSGLIDCQKNVVKCTQPSFFKVMVKYCAGTCGLCQKSECRDQHVDCRSMKALCKDSQHRETMSKQCARTCGFCSVDGLTPPMPAPAPQPAPPPAPVATPGPAVNPSKACVDLSKSCASRTHLCGHPLYLDFMKRHCAKTCNMCEKEPVVPANDCQDMSKRCANWVKRGFCTNDYYSLAYRKANCAKSCNLC